MGTRWHWVVSAGLAVLIVSVLLPRAAVGQINWQSWSDAAFQRAARENKLIFVDVGTEWCSACNAMKAGSYKDPRVHKLLNKHFVAIHVDAEAEPDIGERYGFWGWPALVFMTPKGKHVHFVRGYMLPKDFVWLLNELTGRHAFLRDQCSAFFQPMLLGIPLLYEPEVRRFAEFVEAGFGERVKNADARVALYVQEHVQGYRTRIRETATHTTEIPTDPVNIIASQEAVRAAWIRRYSISF